MKPYQEIEQQWQEHVADSTESVSDQISLHYNVSEPDHTKVSIQDPNSEVWLSLEEAERLHKALGDLLGITSKREKLISISDYDAEFDEITVERAKQKVTMKYPTGIRARLRLMDNGTATYHVRQHQLFMEMSISDLYAIAVMAKAIGILDENRLYQEKK